MKNFGLYFKFYITFKRVFDFILSIIAIVLLGPILLIVAGVIKFTSPGPVFYAQERVGLNNKHFFMLKFRSMVPDAEVKSGPTWATENDPRITPIGRFMRKSRIDELPQLFNVLKNEMSLVGPRAERPHFVDKFTETIPNYRVRHKVLPGITGEAQIFNGYDTCIDDVIRKVQYDLAYLKNMGFIYDIKIMFKTVSVIITGKGAL